jgi:hypothetical protein
MLTVVLMSRARTVSVAVVSGWLRVATLAGLSFGVVCPVFGSVAESDCLDEAQVKAAFLYSFAKFTQWPTLEGRPNALSIGIVGADRFGDVLGSIQDGGVIQFYIRNNRVRFQINAAAANDAGLRISSQLLSLSR